MNVVWMITGIGIVGAFATLLCGCAGAVGRDTLASSAISGSSNTALIRPIGTCKRSGPRNGSLPLTVSVSPPLAETLRAWRILELMLCSQPVVSIEAVGAAASDVDLVSPLSDVLGRYDHERWRM